jgi:hypothetical protein
MTAPVTVCEQITALLRAAGFERRSSMTTPTPGRAATVHCARVHEQLPRCLSPENEDALDRMAERLNAKPEILDRHREIGEHPFGTIKQWAWAFPTSPKQRRRSPNYARKAWFDRRMQTQKDAEYARLLRTIKKTDPAGYERGVGLYMDSEMRFNGLIEELKVDLIAGEDLARSAKFGAELQELAETRVAFTTFVKQERRDKLKGARADLPDVAKTVTELVKAATDTILSIWKAYHENDEKRREELLNELEHLKWQPFSELIKK